MKKILFILLAVVLAVSVGLIGCTAPTQQEEEEEEEEEPQVITPGDHVIIGSWGGAKGAISTGICSLIEDELGIEATMTTGVGSATLLRYTMTKETHFCTLPGGTLYDAYHGVGAFEEDGPQPIRAVQQYDPGALMLVVRADSDIYSAADLRGKRFMYAGEAAPDCNIVGRVLLEVNGMTATDVVTQVYTTGADARTALQDRTTDAFVDFDSFNAASYVELSTLLDIRMVTLSEEERDAILAEIPYYSKGTIPAGMYRGVEEDVLTLLNPIQLGCHRDLSEDFVYNVMKVMLDSCPTIDSPGVLATFGPGGEFMTPASNRFHPFGDAPFHAGAVRYLQERGVWTDEMDALQQQILDKMGETR